MKYLICGSRDIDPEYALAVLEDHMLTRVEARGGPNVDFQVISGTARGGDTVGETFAGKYDWPVIRMPAEWQKYGKGAGFIRNEKMVQQADIVIALYDGISKGTWDTIVKAAGVGLEVAILPCVRRAP